jgi:hypothetical protein
MGHEKRSMKPYVVYTRYTKQFICALYSLNTVRSSIRSFVSRGYKTSADRVSEMFHAVLDTLSLTADNSIYMIKKLGSRRVWPVNRVCLLLLGTWSLRLCLSIYISDVYFLLVCQNWSLFGSLVISWDLMECCTCTG